MSLAALRCEALELPPISTTALLIDALGVVVCAVGAWSVVGVAVWFGDGGWPIAGDWVACRRFDHRTISVWSSRCPRGRVGCGVEPDRDGCEGCGVCDGLAS
jgi:hypothetical protein